MGIANTPASYMWLKHKKYRGDSAFQVRGSSLALKVAGKGCCCLIDTQMHTNEPRDGPDAARWSSNYLDMESAILSTAKQPESLF